MARIIEDRILESSTTVGTGAIALEGAVVGFRRFSAVCAVGDTVPYYIEAINSLGSPTGDYEYGIGTYSAANTLTRTTVQGSSSGGSAVNFAAGSKNVGIALTKSELTNQINTLVASAIPAGAIFHFAANAAPAGYVKANGALLSRTTYAALWAHAQASGNIAASDGAWTSGQYSPGDGTTTFRVPDLRGEFLRSFDDGRGVDTGRAMGSAQGSQNLSHSHGASTDTTGGHTHNLQLHTVVDTNLAGKAQSSGGNPNYTEATDSAGAHSHTVTVNADGGSEARPRNVALLACIKT